MSRITTFFAERRQFIPCGSNEPVQARHFFLMETERQFPGLKTMRENREMVLDREAERD